MGMVEQTVDKLENGYGRELGKGEIYHTFTLPHMGYTASTSWRGFGATRLRSDEWLNKIGNQITDFIGRRDLLLGGGTQHQIIAFGNFTNIPPAI
jgi:hypothetical protein